MKLLKLGLFAAIITIQHCSIFGQMTKNDSIWMPFDYFIGKWEGTGTSGDTNGKYERSYAYIFNKKYIEVRNKAIYPPSKENPNGEIHEDLGYISYDKSRKTFILRQLHIEGFVNQYKLDSISKDSKTIIFRTESIENIAPGWSARENYKLLNENEFTETFELAEPNGVFEEYSKAKLLRVIKKPNQ